MYVLLLPRLNNTHECVLGSQVTDVLIGQKVSFVAIKISLFI
jgi:hypothetical protein